MAKGIKRLGLILVAAALLLIAYYGFSFVKFGIGIHEHNQPQAGNNPSAGSKQQGEEEYVPPKWEGTDRVNILVLGGDSRDLDHASSQMPRTDTMLIVSIDPVTKQASLFSILRDTYVQIPNRGHSRINAATVLGGAELAMETVSEFTGLPVQYYVYVDFQGFVALVDAIGGVEYYVEKDMQYRSRADGPEWDIDLKQGLQTLDGKKALQYVRFRHDALSDYARTERQRKFLMAVAEKMQTTANLLRLPSILNKIEPYIQTNLSLNDMVKLGTLAFQVNTDSIGSVQLPPNHLLREETIGGASVITVDRNQLQQFVEESLQPPAPEESEQTETGIENGDSDAAAPQ